MLFVHVPEVYCAGLKRLSCDWPLGYQAVSHGFWQKLMEEILTSDNQDLKKIN